MNKWFVILGSEKNILTEKHVLRLRLLSTVLHCFFSMLRAGVSLSLCPAAQKNNNAAQQDIRLHRAALIKHPGYHVPVTEKIHLPGIYWTFNFYDRLIIRISWSEKGIQP